jgi:hypothetical protein
MVLTGPVCVLRNVVLQIMDPNHAVNVRAVLLSRQQYENLYMMNKTGTVFETALLKERRRWRAFNVIAGFNLTHSCYNHAYLTF